MRGARLNSAMPYVIKRYSNRKLYDTQESRYVTLEELEELIRAGREISVVDVSTGEDLTSGALAPLILEDEERPRAGRESSVVDGSTGEDLTSVTLAQIILENERSHRATLPTAFLHQLIKHGEAWQDYAHEPPPPS